MCHAKKGEGLLPGVPVHIIQRGNDCQPVFFCDDDYWRYPNDLKLASQDYTGDTPFSATPFVLMNTSTRLESY